MPSKCRVLSVDKINIIIAITNEGEKPQTVHAERLAIPPFAPPHPFQLLHLCNPVHSLALAPINFPLSAGLPPSIFDDLVELRLRSDIRPWLFASQLGI